MKLRAIVILFACLAALHAVASVPFPWSLAAMGAALLHADPDLVVLLGVVVLGGAAGWPRLSACFAALLLLVSLVFRVANGHMLVHHARTFDLVDLRDLPALDHLLLHELPGWLQIAALTAGGLATVALWGVLTWAFARVARTAAAPRGALLAAAVLQLVVLAGPARQSLAPNASPLWQTSSLATCGRQAVRLAAAWLDPEASDGPIRSAIAAAQQRMAQLPADLGGLAGADVHLVFVESYGCVALRHPELGAQLRALWAELGAELRAAGFTARTRACRPSIYGGFSWLAHAELYAGLHVANRRTRDLLHESELKPLPKFFLEAGYHTAEVLPTMHIHWPAGQRFHGYVEEVTQLELAYPGTVYHFGQMPDQWALHHLLERIVAPATKPLFTTFVSVTSHAPFSMIPPYVADWKIDATTFAGPPRVTHALTVPVLLDNPLTLPAYQDAIEYSLRCVAGFTARLKRPSLVIVLGDHQPPMARNLLPSDTSFDVPMHVFANRPELLAPFAAMQFGEGFGEPPGVEPFDTSEFAAMLLRGFAKKPQ